jgi:hypothetical protein
MKILFIVLILDILLVVSVDAMSVDEQILEIQNSSPQQRVKLMNEFKKRVASMNAAQRQKSISQLQKKMNVQNNMQHNNMNIREMQTQHNNYINQSQHMGQQQMLNQLNSKKPSHDTKPGGVMWH